MSSSSSTSWWRQAPIRDGSGPRVRGPGGLRLDAQGDLVLAADGREIRVRKPVVYQETEGGRREVAGGYVLAGRDEVRFAVAPYDSRLALVIDPVIAYSSFLGGSGNDGTSDLGVDATGNMYLAGTTGSFDYPLMNPLQGTKPNGLRSIFISKLNPAGSALLYSTYLGGSGDDPCFRMAVDSTGNAYVTGPTTSTNFPTKNAFQGVNRGGSDIYLAKLNPAGNSLLYSTFLGGTGFDNTEALGVNDAGQAVVAGMTNSQDFPLKNPAQSTFGGGFFDAFVAKFDTNQTGPASLIYSTYFGGSGDEMASGDTVTVSGAAAVDAGGNAYVAGTTTSTNLPTLNPFQPTYGGTDLPGFVGLGDAFVAKFDANGVKVYATYLGGTGFENVFGITADAFGSAYVVGQTASPNFPIKNPIPDRQSVGSNNHSGFVTKLDAGGALVYSSFLGGNGDEATLRIVVDVFGSAYVTGGTASTDFPVVSPVQGAFKGGPGDAFVSQFHPSGNRLLFSTYLGGSNNDTGVGIATRGDGNIYVASTTNSFDFPVVAPFQATLRGGGDSAITKINAASPALVNISTRALVEMGSSVLIGGLIVRGTTPKTVLLRGRGPSLSDAPFFVPGTLPDPLLRLFSGPTLIAQNDNWQDDPSSCSGGFVCGTAAQITATGLDPCEPNPGQSTPPPSCALESAMLVTLPPGAYTAQLLDASGGVGVGLVEAFDIGESMTANLHNLSTRGVVGTGDQIMIGGFVIEGSTPKTVLVRGRGPFLGDAPFFVPGTLTDPFLRIFSGAIAIAQNDNWQDAPSCSGAAIACGTPAQITATGLDPCEPNPGQGAPPTDCALESAILITLYPGAYTVQLSGAAGQTGVGLVEIFEIPF